MAHEAAIHRRNLNASGLDQLARTDDSALARLYARILEEDLDQHVLELHLLGYTIIPPGRVASDHEIEVLRQAILGAASEELGLTVDVEDGFEGIDASRLPAVDSPVGLSLRRLLPRDDVYERAILNPVVEVLLSYLLGENHVLDRCDATVKAAGTAPLPIHCDEMMPPPLPQFAQTANVTWLLSDYETGDGQTTFVPGSHTRCRQPRADLGEGVMELQPVTAAKGSLLVWHGNTWHAAMPRTNRGLRVTFVSVFKRCYLKVAEGYPELLAQSVAHDSSSRLTTLLGPEAPGPRPYSYDAACSLF